MTLIKCNEVTCKYLDKRGYCKEGYIELDNNYKCEYYEKNKKKCIIDYW